MQRVVFIINSLQRGGAERQLPDLSRIMQKGNISLTVFTLLPNGELKDDLVNIGITVVEFEFNRVLQFGKQFWKMRKLIRKINPVAIHTWMYHSNLIGGVVGRMAGCANIIWSIHHNSISLRINKLSTIFLIFLSSFFSYFIPRRIVYVSDAAKATHERIRYRKLSVVIPNGIDTDYFRVSKPKSSYSILPSKGNRLYIGFFARFDPIKNCERFLHAFKEAASLCKKENIELKLVVAGIGMNSKNSELIQYLNKYELNNEILLLGAQNNMPETISSVDIVANPSLKESFSLILAEAMACNVMCISSWQGDPLGLIDNDSFHFNAYNINDIISCIVKAVKHKLENKETAIDTRSIIVEKYSISKIVNAYLELYNESLTGDN